MNHRVRVEPGQIERANNRILQMLNRRLNQKGRGGYIGPHETLGVLAEEWDEFIEAVRSDDPKQVEAELIDIAVGCLFGLASHYQNEIAAKEEKAAASEEKFGSR